MPKNIQTTSQHEAGSKQRTSIIRTEVLRGFSQSFQVNARTAPQLGHDHILLGLFFYHEGGGDMFLRNVG
jgi:hypothetical protein